MFIRLTTKYGDAIVCLAGIVLVQKEEGLGYPPGSGEKPYYIAVAYSTEKPILLAYNTEAARDEEFNRLASALDKD